MSKAKRRKPYKEGPRLPITLKWKSDVLDALEENKKAGRKPGSIPQLAKVLDADKTGFYRTFDFDLDPPQMSSAYRDEIGALLNIPAPLVEPPPVPDEEREADLAEFEKLPPHIRKEVIRIGRLMK